jgi:hypothetical protein
MIKTFTLGYNLPQEITSRLAEMGEHAKGHTVIDLGFPLIADSYYSIRPFLASELLMKSCFRNESNYMKVPNKGVSQNWSSAFRELQVGLEDVLIGVEPDEVCYNYDWIPVMGAVLEADKTMAVVSLNTDGHQSMIDKGQLKHSVEYIAGHKVYVVHGLSNWAMIGVSGRFLHRCEGMPVPKGHSVYGHIESACYAHMKDGGYRWCILADHFCKHIETSVLYREYKTDVTSGDYTEKKQITFDKWLEIKKATQP